ncbi:MAG: hypothetical protein DKM22_02295 [Candidatus Melainabacteria bacterium]|nr:MAG: hypothetical protein DKM22_02295 [Candidatus Melainabacteria bacterium]
MAIESIYGGFDSFFTSSNRNTFRAKKEENSFVSNPYTNQTAYANPMSMNGSIFGNGFQGGTASAFDA